ncbi:PAS domain-containing protein [Ramlibacter terrae]|uniref:histidine kinase n=1 Tax=Ramlibacter terrae TaxID=2732511 RepID=A0ABX6P3S2_9BURK|nr:PAS domain-containing protein [Ramlibacter terrae]
MRFDPLEPPGLQGILHTPLILLLAFCATLCLVSFYVYLSKVLRHLDPAQAVPSRVRSALDSLTEGLLVVDQKRNVVLANEALTRLLGKTNEQMMGTPVDAIEWLDDAGVPLPQAAYPWTAALDSGTVQRDLHLKLRDHAGRQRSFVVNCSPVIAAAGKASGVLISLEDITLLEESRVELRSARDEAEAANRAKSEFPGEHEPRDPHPHERDPGFTELLRRGFGKSERESSHYLDTIHHSGKHLLGLINDILDLSKVEAGQLSVEAIACEPHTVIRGALAELGLKAQEKGIALSLRLLTPVPEQVHSDPARIRQVILNLLSNAVKFTERGGVEVVLACNGNSYTVEVSDSGIGIAPDKVESMFDPFTQADASITRRFGGTGLGLAISRRLARALGGDLTASSQPGVGTTMIFTFGTGALEGVRMLRAEDLVAPARRGGGAGPPPLEDSVGARAGGGRRRREPRAAVAGAGGAGTVGRGGRERPGRGRQDGGRVVRPGADGHADAGARRLRGHPRAAPPRRHRAHRGADRQRDEGLRSRSAGSGLHQLPDQARGHRPAAAERGGPARRRGSGGGRAAGGRLGVHRNRAARPDRGRSATGRNGSAHPLAFRRSSAAGADRPQVRGAAGRAAGARDAGGERTGMGRGRAPGALARGRGRHRGLRCLHRSGARAGRRGQGRRRHERRALDAAHRPHGGASRSAQRCNNLIHKAQ